jgi:hypothetical protein
MAWCAICNTYFQLKSKYQSHFSCYMPKFSTLDACHKTLPIPQDYYHKWNVWITRPKSNETFATCSSTKNYAISQPASFLGQSSSIGSAKPNSYPEENVLELIYKWNKLFCSLRIFCKFMFIFLAKVLI